MQAVLGKPEDIVSWMELVCSVKDNFPGLDTEKEIAEHRETVLRFIEKR